MSSFQDTKFRQDMPPEGGYAKIYTQRTFPRVGSKTGKRFGLAMAVLFGLGVFKQKNYFKAQMRWTVEQNDVKLVMNVFQYAERDRLWLKFLRRNREEERALMKDVPGWRVGTFYGEPIFYTLPPDNWWDPTWPEIQAHTSFYNRNSVNKWRIDADCRGGPKWYDKYLPTYMAEL